MLRVFLPVPKKDFLDGDDRVVGNESLDQVFGGPVKGPYRTLTRRGQARLVNF